MSKRKKWSSTEKFEIALLALKGEMTLNAICKPYTVASCQIQSWKKQLLNLGSGVFSKSEKAAEKIAEHERKERLLYEKLGQLTMERDFLKKCYGKLHENNGEN